MSVSQWLCVACLLAAPPVLAAPPPAPKTKTPNNPTIARFKAQFDKMDLNQDTFLDRDELARAFRGPSAKAPRGNMYDDQGNLTKLYYQAKTRYPEMVFLWAADKNGDDVVSWSEYETCELNLLKAQQQQQQAVQRLARSTRRRTTTRSYRTRPRTVYRPRGSNYYSHARRSVTHYGYAQNGYQQVIAAMMNWQRNQMRMQAYCQTMMWQRLMQQRMLTNYIRMRQSPQYRMMQQHMAAAYHAEMRRRATMYQSAMRQRMQAQQRRVNYLRQRQAPYYRAVQQHRAQMVRMRFRR